MDFEFIEQGNQDRIWPISIGLVCEDGREYYAEWFDIPWFLANEWVLENVKPNLTYMEEQRKTGSLIRSELEDFIGDDRRPEFWGWYCVGPETKVLMSDLTWKEAGEVKQGDILMGFDEEGQQGSGRSKRWRQWRSSEVQRVELVQQPCYDLVFSDGTTVRASANHRWLTKSGKAAKWVKTEDLRLYDDGASNIVKPLDVWETDSSRGAGYLAAAFDGEGHLSQDDISEKGGVRRTRLGFAQRYNAMLEEVQLLLSERGFKVVNSSQRDLACLTIGNRSDVLRFLGSIRPLRLLDKFKPDAVGAMSLDTVKLVEKNFVGSQEVVSMTTSTGTFIAEGLASHNCDYDWVVFCGIWGTMADLPEYFPRYCRDVKQLCDDLGNPRLPEQEGEKHHALHDTLWIVQAYEFLWRYALDHSVVAQAALQRACEELLGAIGEGPELKDKAPLVWRELMSRVRALQSEHEAQASSSPA